MSINVLNEYKQHNDFLIELVKEKNKEIQQLKEVYQDRCEDIDFYVEVLRKIDTHIRSTKEPIPYIIETLKSHLPEYQNEFD